MSHNKNWSWKPPAGTEKTLQDGNAKVREFHKRWLVPRLGGEGRHHAFPAR